MSVLHRASTGHTQAAADRAAAERDMGSRWRDAAARVVEARVLTPLTVQDRAFATALSQYDDELSRALRMIDRYL